jgi:PAS domain S-box-containing protein/diguanylate cyclase (GGDEF)-like protein
MLTSMTPAKPAHKILRVLLLDDSPDDAEQASAVLRQAGYMLKTQRLETGVAVEQNLEASQWDLVLCGHGIANLPARQVVDLVAHKKLLTPVIVLARRIGDDELRTLMQAGARDVIIKGQWGRLLPAVERELAVADERRRWIEGGEALRNLEARYRTMIEASIEAIAYVQDGMHMDANPAYLKLFGYDRLDDLKEVPLLNLIDKTDQARFKQALKKPEGADKAQEFQAVTATGTRISLEVAMTPLTIGGQPCVQVVATDISKRKALESKLQSMHQRDSLTGLFSRAHFLTLLGDTLKTPGGVLIGLTVNRLAEINQQLGHVACDRLLVQIGLQLRELAGNTATLARISGGQFAVLLDAKAAAQAPALESRIQEMLGTLTAGDGDQRVKPDVTVARVALDGAQKDRQAIMDQAFKTELRPVPAAPAAAPVPPPAPKPVPAVADIPSLAIEPAAAPPSAPTRPPVPTMPTISTSGAREDLREAMQQALTHNRMELLFQPIVNLHGEPHCFYEAQLMLVGADGAAIPPSRYLPSADVAGLAGKLDRATMLNVIDTLSKYHVEGRPGIVFVGLSNHAVQDNALLSAVQMHMKATGLDPSKLVLQIDEQALAHNFEAARAFLDKAKALGTGIAINNFANRAVSLEQLAQLPVDFIAVNCGPDGLAEDVLYGAIDAILAIDRMIIARGIEDAELFSTLFSRGVHYVQGDYLQPASSGLDYSFEAEQTLTSDEPPGPSWRVAG